MKKIDARVRYTQKVLKESFLKLLEEKPVNKITVKEVCELAELNRATFYAHYTDCFALLESIEDEMLEGFEESAEVNVTLVNDEMIREMNRQYRDIDASTDVLSFPLGENGVYDENPETGAKMLGDIVISVEHALSQADLYGHGIEREVAFLTVHSMLHLLGYDHEQGGLQKTIMREKEEQVLDALGLAINKL